MKFHILIGLLGILALAGASAQEQRETVTLRVECRKTDDRGCTGDDYRSWSAPNGRYIDVASLGAGTVDGYWKKEPRCGVAQVATYTNANIPGVPTPIALPISFRAVVHVESGAGLLDIGRVAWVNCIYTVTTYPIP